MIIYHTNGPKLLDLIYTDHLAMLSDSARDVMERSLRNSPDAWVAYHEEKILGFCGVIPPTILSETAYLWMYATKHFAAHQTICMRQSPRLMADALRRYPIIVGHCTRQSYQWLQWLGATIGNDSGPLIPFRIEAP